MRARAVLTAVAAALLLSGCGPAGSIEPMPTVQPGADRITAGPEVRPATGASAARAAEVAAAWPGSELQRTWEHGYFPLDAPTEWLPDGAFRGMGDKAAYLDGRIDLGTALPVSVSGLTEVRFADGSALALPQRSAQDVYASLTHRSDSCAADCDTRLTVTAVRPGTATVTTSRGRATIATWEFTLDGYAGPFRYPAVLPQQPPPPTGTPDQPDDGIPAELRAVSPDGLVLTAVVPYGCAVPGPGTVYETDRAVVLIGRADPRGPGPDGACDAALHLVPVEFRLARPLGTRTVLGLADGRPQLPRP
ncbi:hypothetical protein [Kitasatospora phosalacinea]|uniref:Lipoprotein n=1 Tax=Kitasatospora phosalacinea TaxID=2065 RepID=A0A9W6PBZ7_9ACTN|nr:hypothetical protein [Kitasatospora phosalacinea]GLW52326.1 hypothetical protein Kpho01_03370 [Kitasatospora phosalacinea]